MSAHRKLVFLQTLIIGGGLVFSWSALAGQFRRFYGVYDTIFHFQDCVVPNPILTPCFYGALAFLGAFIWSFSLAVSFRTRAQYWLRNFLLFGVVFALSVFGYETLGYYTVLKGPQITCVPGSTPLETPCFYGALFFIAAYVVAVFTLRSASKRAPVS